MKKLPFVEWYIDEKDLKSGVDFVALVDEGAITLNYQVFSKDGNKTDVLGIPLSPQKFEINKGRGIVAGPVMIPNLPIYRKDDQYGEYYGFFSKETVRQIRDKFMRKKFTDNVNLMHEAGLTVDDVYMVDSFIIDKEMGYPTPLNYGHELTEGTWWMGFKVENPEVLEVVKNQLLKGFSVEGRFYDKYLGNVEDDLIKDLEEIILGDKVAKK
jgi:hypothetical protein